jgi:hypothetical protein
MPSHHSTTGLNFASLIRVSTDRQAKRGESLITQRDGNARDAERLGGRIVAHYGGQEHATAGHERRELDRLIADAGRGVYNAVIVAYSDRWSRDNRKSKEGLDAFRGNGIRFFVGTGEMDLFDPNHCLILGMHAEIGEFIANQQSRKSMESRVSRARRGIPVAGELPFARTYTDKDGWGLDAGKAAKVREAARRYLAGESLNDIADSLGMFLSQLQYVLAHRCGPTWTQEFRSARLGIHERVETPVPRLLGDEVIRAVKDRARANRTVFRGPVKHRFLLANLVICGTCGCSLFGNHSSRGVRVYRHYSRRKLASWGKSCADVGMQVRADDLEDAALRGLFDLFGNADRVRQAVEDAIPDKARVDDTRRQLEQLVADQRQVEARKARVVRAIAHGMIEDADASREMAELRRQADAMRVQANKLKALLASTPTREQVEATAARLVDRFGRRHVDVKKLIEDRIREDQVRFDFDGMSWEERKGLLGLVFNGTTPEGQRLGVYVTRAVGQLCGRRQVWDLRLLGLLVDRLVTTPAAPWEPREPDDQEFSGAPLQGELLESVTGSEQH